MNCWKTTMSDPMLTRLAERFAQLSPAQRKKFYQKLQDQGQELTC